MTIDVALQASKVWQRHVAYGGQHRKPREAMGLLFLSGLARVRHRYSSHDVGLYSSYRYAATALPNVSSAPHSRPRGQLVSQAESAEGFAETSTISARHLPPATAITLWNLRRKDRAYVLSRSDIEPDSVPPKHVLPTSWSPEYRPQIRWVGDSCVRGYLELSMVV